MSDPLEEGVRLYSVGLYIEAIEALKKAAQSNEDGYLVHHNLGKAYFGLRRYDEALEAFKEAKEFEANDNETLWWMGRTCYTLNRLDEAKYYLDECLASNPLHLAARYTKALVYKAGGHFQEAVVELDEVIRETPGRPDLYIELGKNYYEMGNLDDAAKCFKHAIQLAGSNPIFSEAYFWLGTSYVTMASYEKAIEALEIAFRLKPDPGTQELIDLAQRMMGKSN